MPLASNDFSRIWDLYRLVWPIPKSARCWSAWQAVARNMNAVTGRLGRSFSVRSPARATFGL